MSEEEDDENIYNADLYTDAELMEFLDMTPQSTDRELEAKIIQMMHQFPDHRAFFEDIYRRLFDLKDEDEDEGTTLVSQEGMTGMTTPTTTTGNKKPGEATNVQDKLKELIESFEKNIVQKAEKLTQAQINENLKIAGLTPEDRARQSTVFTKALDYIKDPKNLNPTFNNTIQRVIILDSRCRDRNTNPKSTDFTLTLSESLKNVLALNFYYVNVPYTWYTVSSQYGANFFLLNGMAPGIQDAKSDGNNSKYSLKFEINPGNYTTSQALVDAINASIQAVAQKRTDISFGTSSVVLTSPTAGSGKATFTWDIQNRFGDSSYELHFPNWTSPVDWTPSPLNGGEKNSSTVASLSIPGFLGFLQPTYSLASVYSNILYTYGDIMMYPSPLTLFDVDDANNKFYIYNHDVSRRLDIADPTTYYDKIEVSLNMESGSYNRQDLVKNVTSAMQRHPQLNNQYSGLFYEKTSFTNPDDDFVQRFRLCVQLNRFTTKNHRNQVQTVVFPKESNDDTSTTIIERYPVWTGPDSALYFDDSPMTMNSTRAEIGSEELARSTTSSNETDNMDDGYSTKAYHYYIVEDSPKMHFMCTRMPSGIADAFNQAHSFTVSVPNTGTDPGFYTLSTYLYAVNEAIRTQLPPKFTLKTTTPFYYDYYGTGKNYDSNPSTNPTFDSYIYADIGLNRNFTTSEYTVNATNSILHKTFNLPPIMNLSQQTRYTSRFAIPFNNQYRIDNTNRQITIGRLNPADGEPKVTVFLPYAPPTSSTRRENPHDGQWYVYNGLDDLRAAFTGKSGFQQYKNDSAVYQVAPDSTGTYGSPRNMTDIIEPLYGLTLAGTDISFVKVNDTTAECTLTWNIFNRLTEQDYTVVLDGQSWTDNLGFEQEVDDPSALSRPSFVLAEWTAVGAPVATIYALHDVATTGISIHDATIDEEQVQNNEIVVQPRAGADSLSQLADQLTFSILPGYYSRFGLVRALNAALQSNPITAGTKFMWYNGGLHSSSSSSSSSSSLNLNEELENVRINWNINKVYTAEDYSQMFWDLEKFSSVQNSYSTTENLVIRWDQTVGWLLGFRSLTSYDLLNSSATSDNFSIAYANTNAYTFDPKTDIVTLAGDIPVNINLYNQLHVILDDYTSNHMNDGIITVAPPSVNTTLQSYASRAGKRCTVVINGERVSVPGFINTDPANTDAQGRVPRLLTQAQLYSSLAQNQARLDLQNAVAKTYSPPPNVKDMFALIPLKLTGLTVGQSYTEFGGTLQQNNRKYYGPVNIGRIGLKLLSDRGTLVDLNNNDWSIGIICDISIQA